MKKYLFFCSKCAQFANISTRLQLTIAENEDD